MLGVGCVLAPPEHETAAEEHEDLVGDPLPWTESMGSGGPLLYAGLLRWQVSAMQVQVCFWSCLGVRGCFFVFLSVFVGRGLLLLCGKVLGLNSTFNFSGICMMVKIVKILLHDVFLFSLLSGGVCFLVC